VTACTGPSRELACEDSSACVRGGEQGACLMPEGYCAFDDPGCTSGMRWDSTAGDDLAGDCVAATGDQPDAMPGEMNACGGMTTLEAEPGTACGACDTGAFQCSGTNAVVCQGAVSLSVPIAFEGAVTASTEFNSSFVAGEAVDGDFTTSWFSTGPEPGGVPTNFTWSASGEDCIEQIQIINNGQHSNPDFRTGFGFGQVTIQVFDGDDALVYSRVEQLQNPPDEPDPNVTVSPGVMGRRVTLLFLGHEAPDCGGFSELLINALR
jgi:hypothetical protein